MYPTDLTVAAVVERDGRYLLVNDIWSHVMGIDRESALGCNDYDFLPADVVEPLLAHDRQIIATGEPLHFQESTGSGPDARSFISNKFPLYDADGKMYAVGGVSTDITELTNKGAE